MIRLALSLLAISLAVSLVSSCSRADDVVEPVWGKQPCAHCAMVLSDRRFGAQLLTVTGDRAYFDDVGCMVLYLEAHPGSPARSTYFYTMYLFDNAFIYHKMGYACAMGWILFVIILALTRVSLKMSEKHVHYEGG